MQKACTTICSILSLCLLILCAASAQAEFGSSISLQSDGSLVFFDSRGGITDLVKQGTPRQSVNLGGQSLNVSYGFNSAGKKTILVSLPKSSTSPVDFSLSDTNVSIPPGSALRITLSASNQPERMEGAPAGTVTMSKGTMTSALKSEVSTNSETRDLLSESLATPAPSTQAPTLPETPRITPIEGNLPLPEPKKNLPTPSTPSPQESLKPQASSTSTTPQSPTATDETSFWPGKFLDHPIPAEQMEEDHFYIRTEGGARLVSPMNILNVSGGTSSPSNPIIQKQISFGTGYRQDIDAGVWLTDWFGLAIETGFALNTIEAYTSGMTVSESTYWSIPLMAQLCFQYPNESGFLPYINLGFGGGWNFFKIGSINYQGSNLTGNASDINNAYQIAAGVRYRLYDQLSLTLAYKFYGTSQPSMGLNNDQQVTFGSPVTNSVEIGGNFAF